MRWLLTSWGSHGDLHPFLALGRGLKARGHEVTLVGHPDWAADTAAAEIRFVSTGEPSREDFIRDHPELLNDRQKVCDLCASVQEAIVEVLEAKTFRAAARLGIRCITVSGGVSCNQKLRQRFEQAAQLEKITLRLADKSLCTDNAAMIGILAERKLLANVPLPSLDEEIQPGWVLA